MTRLRQSRSASGSAPSPCTTALRAAQATPPRTIEPMLGIDELARILAASRRSIERLRSAGKLPKPDLHIGRMPRWKAETIRRWIEGGGRP